MNTYIALLRAINVGGHRKIKMAELREVFSTMGYENIKTYIQSGNVVFKSPETDINKLSGSIESQILQNFGHEVDVMIRTPNQLQKLTESNPFQHKESPQFMLYITFFKQALSIEKQQDFISLSSDIEKYTIENGELFSLINKKTDRKTMFSNNYVEKIAGISGTTRNWNSVLKITALALDDNN